MTPKELREKRVTLINNARAILDKADAEKRQPTAEERTQFDKMMEDADKLRIEIETVEKDINRRSILDKFDTELKDQKKETVGLQNDGQPEKRVITLKKNIAGDNRQIILQGETATDKYRKMFRDYIINGNPAMEMRALQKDVDTTGGYLSAPMEFMAELIAALDNSIFMRQICRVLPPLATADSIGAPSLDTDIADPVWTAEIATGTEDSSLAFGRRELRPHPLAKYIKISKTLLRRSAMDAETIVRDRLQYKLGVVEEAAFMTGTGAQQPLGIFVASDNGIASGRDVATDNTSSAPTLNGLKEAKYTLKTQYWPRAQWVMHRLTVKLIDKIKDGEGRYIWQPSIVVGQPDLLLNFPVRMSEYAPSTYSVNQYVAVLGDFDYYWIVDALTMTIQVVVELYAAANQNGYFARLECDGMPVLSEAFVRVKLAAS